ncbi:glycosyltransferase [Cobetia sp. L2A1]|uniref:glycosyltransferase n=1 Tax=Cobetia sp. L2A1 TaxID=2686360 RepID=UPI00131AE513|nr:glycosyltransferase [Cobetia sp. L2A1]
MLDKGTNTNNEQIVTGYTLDLQYYKSRYHDLKLMSDAQIINHWHYYGKLEGRVCSGDHAKSLMLQTDNINAKSNSLSELKDSQNNKSVTEFKAVQSTLEMSLVKPFDDAFYAALYLDLEKTRFYREKKLYKHYDMFGEKEGRIATLSQWLKGHGYPDSIASHDFSYGYIYKLNSTLGIEITLKDVLGTFSAEINVPVSFYEDDQKNAEFYLRIAKYYLEIGDKTKAKKLLESSNSFFSLSASLELLGNLYLDQGHNRIALGYYNSAKALSNTPKWLYFNRATCLVRLQQYEKALTSLAEGLEAYGEFTFQHEKLDEFAEDAWNNVFPALLSYVGQGNREELVRAFDTFSEVVYDAYLRACGTSENPAILPSLNLDRILIVGDYHIAQCERYRINQKVEQLEAVGKEVTAINWLEIDQHAEALATHDVVIFYRVPAMPKILKAMAQTNAVGKLSIYEIDDLIFDPVYPPALASYGGYVSLETYQELTRGMALFHAAARHCRLGLASTEPLRERLAQLVFGKECLLHRNGLDSLNEFSQPLESPKKTLDIFYGSGTQAHNQDFMELALPAIVKLLTQYPHLRLVIVGYLKLPKYFTDRFADQLSLIPPLKSVQGYWSLLRRADINLAVLHDDVMNECKSELKWFEAACHGVPSVVSSTQNYRDVIRDGEDAFLAVTADDWESAITRLVEDKSLRNKMGKAAQQRTRDEYSLEVLGSQLVSSLEVHANRLMDGASYVNGDDGHTELVRKKRKVALVNVFFPPQSIGGATRVVDDNFKALRKHYGDDFELVVFTADSECRTPHQLSMYRHDGVRVYRSTTLWRENMDWHAKDERMYQMFTEFLECEKPDLVHFHCVQRLTGSVVEATRDAKVPYIVTAHDAWWISDFQFLVDHEGTVYPEGHSDPFATINLPPSITQEASVERKLYLKGLLSSAHKVLTVSNAFADIYRKNDIVKIEVTPNGISDDLPWAPKDTSYTKRVVGGHVGGMAEHKGYFLLKEAVMKAQPRNMEFLVVDHSKEEDYESRQFWGTVPVRFIGRTGQDKVVNIYRQIDVLFAPSTWPESFGLVTREAAACGCWVVASVIGGIGEDVDASNGYLIKAQSKAIENILSIIDDRVKTTPALKANYFASEQIITLSDYYKAC